jgi:hypothetical protein
MRIESFVRIEKYITHNDKHLVYHIAHWLLPYWTFDISLRVRYLFIIFMLNTFTSFVQYTLKYIRKSGVQL